MTTKETLKLANELTEKEINNVLKGWENTNEKESINLFNTLVRLGDTKNLALATVISEKYNKKQDSQIYSIAYES